MIAIVFITNRGFAPKFWQLTTADSIASTEPELTYLSQYTSYYTLWIPQLFPRSFFCCRDCLTQSLPLHAANLAITVANPESPDVNWTILLILSRLLHSYPNTPAIQLFTVASSVAVIRQTCHKKAVPGWTVLHFLSTYTHVLYCPW